MRKKIQSREIKHKTLIWVVSILIPIVVAVLFTIRLPNVAPLSFLPPIYAGINGVTALVLLGAFLAVKRKKLVLHEQLMRTAIALSVVFLGMYVAYHMTSDPTPYGGSGPLKYVYYFILITHILLSVGIIPMVLVTYARAISSLFTEHRKIARYTFPIWLYIAVTGVIVYLMIAPYYVT